MSEHPKLRVSKEAVEAARAEVAAYEAAGIVSQLDPMVRRIAEAKPVVAAPKVTKPKFEAVDIKGYGKSGLPSSSIIRHKKNVMTKGHGLSHNKRAVVWRLVSKKRVES